MKKLGVITSLALAAFLTASVVPAGAQTSAGTTASVADPAPASTPVPASVTTNLNLFPSLVPQPAPAAKMSSDDSFHKFDFFAGYSFLNNDIAQKAEGDGVELDHGYAASVTYNLSRHFGILADFSGHNGATTFFGDRVHEDQYYFMFGPSFSRSFGKARVSGHATMGVTKQHLGDSASGETFISAKEYDFAVGVGGSFDWMFSERWGWRVLQFDYLTSIFNGNDFGVRVNNVRGSTGLIVRFW